MPNNRPQLIAWGTNEVEISKLISLVEHRAICKNHNIWFRLIEMSVCLLIFCPSIYHWVSLSRSHAWLSMTFQILFCRFHKLIFTLSRFGLIDLNSKTCRNLRIYSHEFRTTHWIQTRIQTKNKFRKWDNRFGRFWYLFVPRTLLFTLHMHLNTLFCLVSNGRFVLVARFFGWLLAWFVYFIPFFLYFPFALATNTAISNTKFTKIYINLLCVLCDNSPSKRGNCQLKTDFVRRCL